PGYHYYVVVVRSAGPKSDTATLDYTDELFGAWSDHAAARGRPLDQARTVLIVVATENKQVAVHPGTALSRLGLHGENIHEQVVNPSGFLKTVPGERSPEAITALLNQIDRWIDTHATITPRADSAETTATAATAGPSPPARSEAATRTQPGVAVLPAAQ